MADSKNKPRDNGLSVNDIAEIKAHVVKHINRYYSNNDTSKRTTEFMSLPYTYMGSAHSPPNSITTHEMAIRISTEYSKRTKSANPEKYESIYVPSNVTVLSPTAAIISGNNTSLRKDGSIISAHGVVYILSMFPDVGWRIIAFAPTEADTVIKKQACRGE